MLQLMSLIPFTMFENFAAPFLRLPHFRGKTRLEQALTNWLWKAPSTTLLYGLRMELDLNDWSQMQLIKRNWMERETIYRYEEILRPDDVFIDVGANVGFHSLIARHLVGPKGKIIAFEPQPYNANKILDNWRVNSFSNLKLYVAAAGEHFGSVELHNQLSSDRSVLTLLPEGGKNESQSFEVLILRLDSVLAQHEIQRVKLAKVDVEGYELQVLRGLGERLKDIDNVIFEYFDTPERRDANKSLLRLFAHYGFHLRAVNGKKWSEGDTVPESNLWAARL